MNISAQEKEFLSTYGTFGEKDMPNAILPNSARKLFADAEGYLIYSVVVLKKFIPAVQQICRENRYTLRFFDVKELSSSVVEDDDEVQLVQLDAEEQKIKVDVGVGVECRQTCCSGVVLRIRSWRASGSI